MIHSAGTMQLYAPVHITRCIGTPVQHLCRRPSKSIRACRKSHTTAAATGDSTPPVQPSTTPGDVGTVVPPPQKGLFSRIKRFFTGEKMDRERLKALGLGAVASYGMLSNLVYCTGMGALCLPLFLHTRLPLFNPVPRQAWRSRGCYLSSSAASAH